MKVLSEFKDFILRGNIVDLAVAVVIGAAFSGIVSAMVKDLITPLIAAVGGKPDFSALTFTINNSQFFYGDFLNELLSFVIISAVIFFLVVKPMNAILSKLSKKEEETIKEKKPSREEELLTEIRDLLKRSNP